MEKTYLSVFEALGDLDHENTYKSFIEKMNNITHKAMFDEDYHGKEQLEDIRNTFSYNELLFIANAYTLNLTKECEKKYINQILKDFKYEN